MSPGVFKHLHPNPCYTVLNVSFRPLRSIEDFDLWRNSEVMGAEGKTPGGRSQICAYRITFAMWPIEEIMLHRIRVYYMMLLIFVRALSTEPCYPMNHGCLLLLFR